LQLLRPQTLEDQRALRVYRGHVEAISTRVRDVHDSWNVAREIEPDYMRLAKQAERLHAPRMLGGTHKDLLAAVTASARACQLLANGYRFHKSDAICDGQAMLVETKQALEDLLLHVDSR